MEWEYRIIIVQVHFNKPDTKAFEEMEKCGEEGWELISVTPLTEKGTTTAMIHHLRKQKNSERKAGFAP